MALTVRATSMRGSCQTALGVTEFLLRLRCHSLIRLRRISGGQGSTAYRKRFLQGSLGIPWHSAEIDVHFSTYGIALVIRSRLISIARGTFGIWAGGQEMCLFV
jgi:hypothetical protein